MGKTEFEKKKKKKGRPSLIELQKRKLEQERNLSLSSQQYQNPNSNTETRRFTRHNSIQHEPNEEVGLNHEHEYEENDSDDDSSERREKKTRLVIRLPTTSGGGSGQNQRSVNGFDVRVEEKGLFGGNDNEGGSKNAKMEMNQGTGAKARLSHLLGASLENGAGTPLPDKKLLLFILDRLQRKDKYRVFSDPVDPHELPDYFEVIQSPMDFSTVRAKVLDGAYFILEEFEADIFLICSNAMQYNAADTIYYKQARSIQELARKDFENLRQESDDNEPQPPQPKAKRGRPPTRNLKKAFSQAVDRGGSEVSAELRGENWSNSYDLRKGPGFDRFGPSDVSVRAFPGSRNNDSHTSRSADRVGEGSGSMYKGSFKIGKKHFVMDDNRRNTYKPSHVSNGGREPSILTTFDEEKRQLMPVGMGKKEHFHGYAKSLARFAAALGPTAWKVASKKIEKSLPAGVDFGRGWVGEEDCSKPQEPSMSASYTMPSQQTVPPTKVPSAFTFSAAPLTSESDQNISSAKQEPVPFEPTSLEPMESSKALTSGGNIGSINNNVSGIKPQTQTYKNNPANNSAMNGFNGGLGFGFPSQMSHSLTPMWAAGNFGSDISNSHSQVLDMVSRNNNFSHSSMHATPLDTALKMPGGSSSSSSALNPGTSLPNIGHPSWYGFSHQQPNQEAVPPGLNNLHQPSGSPSSSKRLDSPQPDLALQL